MESVLSKCIKSACIYLCATVEAANNNSPLFFPFTDFCSFFPLSAYSLFSLSRHFSTLAHSDFSILIFHSGIYEESRLTDSGFTEAICDDLFKPKECLP